MRWAPCPTGFTVPLPHVGQRNPTASAPQKRHCGRGAAVRTAERAAADPAVRPFAALGADEPGAEPGARDLHEHRAVLAGLARRTPGGARDACLCGVPLGRGLLHGRDDLRGLHPERRDVLQPVELDEPLHVGAAGVRDEQQSGTGLRSTHQRDVARVHVRRTLLDERGVAVVPHRDQPEVRGRRVHRRAVADGDDGVRARLQQGLRPLPVRLLGVEAHDPLRWQHREQGAFEVDDVAEVRDGDDGGLLGRQGVGGRLGERRGPPGDPHDPRAPSPSPEGPGSATGCGTAATAARSVLRRPRLRGRRRRSRSPAGRSPAAATTRCRARARPSRPAPAAAARRGAGRRTRPPRRGRRRRGRASRSPAPGRAPGDTTVSICAQLTWVRHPRSTISTT